jgi:hypothetical protein
MENSTLSSVFLEKYIDTRIKINSIDNNNGILSVDERGNYLNDKLYSSDNKIFRLNKLNGANNIVLYTDKQLSYILGTYDEYNNNNVSNMLCIKPDDIIKYRINVNRVEDYFNGNTYNINLDLTKTILRVELNGKIVNDYILSGDFSTLDFTGNLYVNPYNNAIIVYYYDELEQNYSSLDVEFEYLAPYKFDITYDELFNGIEIEPKASYTDNDNLVTFDSSIYGILNIGSYISINGDRYRIATIEDDFNIRVEGFFYNTANNVTVRLFTGFWLPELNDTIQDEITYTYKTFAKRGGRYENKKIKSSKSSITFNIRINENYYNGDYDVDTSSVPVITTEFKKFFDENDRFRIIIAYDDIYGVEKKIFYTNCTYNNAIKYSQNEDVNVYNIKVDFEKRVTLVGKSYIVSSDDMFTTDAEQANDYIVTID